MATTVQGITCGNFVFYNNFDSANLARVEPVTAINASSQDGCETERKPCKPSETLPDYEFNVWTKHDCHGTEFQNNNRTWFYFGIKSPAQGVSVKLNVVNLNRQSKMFSQGMCPVFKVVPGHPQWERIRDKPTYTDQKGSEFTISFTIRTPENPKAIIYVAFTYPFTYTDLQQYLNRIDSRMLKQNYGNTDAIYYHRECAIKSLEGRRLDVLTISSYHNITPDREEKLRGMFPVEGEERARKFRGKRIIFVSARVHPGETPSSFVFNGFLNFLLNRDDPIAMILRRIYVFKLVPMLNPDGVARGHYRVDTRGVNLNRVYLNPSAVDHPTIFAAKSLISYYHHFYEVVEAVDEEQTIDNPGGEEGAQQKGDLSVTLMALDDKEKILVGEPACGGSGHDEIVKSNCKGGDSKGDRGSEDSGLFLYIDLHGHASKKGVFMYGNYFDDADDTIMCMLLPKLMSINNPNFHFTSCNFAERNMYLIDKRDGMSREGSGRVAVYKLTGLIRSYTLECNYNSGRLVNTIPARVRDGNGKPQGHMFVPPKYTPTVFEEVGAALGPSILDLTNSNPNSRLPNSQYRSLRGVKSYLKLTYVNSLAGTIHRPRLKPLSSHDNIGPLKDSPCLDDLVSTMNSPSNDPNTSQKSDPTCTSKSRIVRRTASLYTAVKRIKSGKRSSRQLSTNRKSLKNHQRLSNSENGQMVSKIRSSRRSMKGLKPVLHKIVGKKGCQVVEQTGIVKQGTKRLKIIQRVIKTRPEIGESSKSSTDEGKRKPKGNSIERIRKNGKNAQRNSSKSNSKK
ncbi:cytosolic carboxypeptidase-like protein 5 isoform X2 [Diachasma alloeum]|uniref:cytosolic carboxypeptidase-like protein 5 isoform X2 n=1 Tax=Diachasma alloeum TaxID=454923 RepID=UPI000738360A|nr:cytosolic carboxypeptidase-like protein 5 isoform X2 [Diachasma alloeum]